MLAAAARIEAVSLLCIMGWIPAVNVGLAPEEIVTAGIALKSLVFSSLVAVLVSPCPILGVLLVVKVAVGLTLTHYLLVAAQCTQVSNGVREVTTYGTISPAAGANSQTLKDDNNHAKGHESSQCIRLHCILIIAQQNRDVDPSHYLHNRLRYNGPDIIFSVRVTGWRYLYTCICGM